MRLENWGVVSDPLDPYTPPEVRAKCLNGAVYEHPRFKDGERIVTSPITGVENDRVLTVSGSSYELGEPAAVYEALYPNAKQRVLSNQF